MVNIFFSVVVEYDCNIVYLVLISLTIIERCVSLGALNRWKRNLQRYIT